MSKGYDICYDPDRVSETRLLLGAFFILGSAAILFRAGQGMATGLGYVIDYFVSNRELRDREIRELINKKERSDEAV